MQTLGLAACGFDASASSFLTPPLYIETTRRYRVVICRRTTQGGPKCLQTLLCDGFVSIYDSMHYFLHFQYLVLTQHMPCMCTLSERDRSLTSSLTYHTGQDYKGENTTILIRSRSGVVIGEQMEMTKTLPDLFMVDLPHVYSLFKWNSSHFREYRHCFRLPFTFGMFPVLVHSPDMLAPLPTIQLGPGSTPATPFRFSHICDIRNLEA